MKSEAKVKQIIFDELSKVEADHYYDYAVWGNIFRQVFGEKPTSTEDRRWDQLLHRASYGGASYAGLDLADEYAKQYKKT